MTWRHAPVFCLLLSCGASPLAPEPESGGSGRPATFELGVNANTINWWDGSRPFANLIYGTGWQMQRTNPWRGGEDVSAQALDANGWVKSVAPIYRITRGLSVPVAGGNIVCRYQGKGNVTVAGLAVTNVRTAAHEVSFAVAPSYPEPKPVTLSFFVDPKDYIRNLDCREKGLSSAAVLAPEFVYTARGFKVMRFMKWQVATETNIAVTWATRNKPGDGDYTKRDGVPIEVMMDTSRELGVDPWFTVPWNADLDYVTRFATYVRDHLATGHRVYVETSNEVWNGDYAVYKQACDEAKAERLTGADGGAACDGERYAEKTRQIMAIWSKAFEGRMDRLVRVFAYHHLRPYWSDKFLGYHDTYKSVDALATAPYFGQDFTPEMGAEQIMAGLPAKVDEALRFVDLQKAVARKYGLRYITYEAGQHVVFRSDVALLRQIQHDSRMGEAYRRFINGWKSRVGDTMTLFALTGSPSQYGSWGAVDYAGQPLAETPKMRAMHEFMGKLR